MTENKGSGEPEKKTEREWTASENGEGGTRRWRGEKEEEKGEGRLGGRQGNIHR